MDGLLHPDMQLALHHISTVKYNHSRSNPKKRRAFLMSCISSTQYSRNLKFFIRVLKRSFLIKRIHISWASCACISKNGNKRNGNNIKTFVWPQNHVNKVNPILLWVELALEVQQKLYINTTQKQSRNLRSTELC